MFRHNLIKTADIRDTTTEAGRVYHTPDGDFQSVTTVLGKSLPSAGLKAWRDRLGDVEANAVVKRAQARGSAVHAIAERYVNNDPGWRDGAMPFNLFAFDPLRALLDKHVGEVWGVELPLWSRRLMTAGRTDLFCEWDGQPAIVDFKTAAKFHGENSDPVRKYLLQTSTYAIMASEAHAINTRKVVLLFSPDDSPTAHAVVRDRLEFEGAVEAIFSPKNRGLALAS